jgi:hypothetical protein
VKPVDAASLTGMPIDRFHHEREIPEPGLPCRGDYGHGLVTSHRRQPPTAFLQPQFPATDATPTAAAAA